MFLLFEALRNLKRRFKMTLLLAFALFAISVFTIYYLQSIESDRAKLEEIYQNTPVNAWIEAQIADKMAFPYENAQMFIESGFAESYIAEMSDFYSTDLEYKHNTGRVVGVQSLSEHEGLQDVNWVNGYDEQRFFTATVPLCIVNEDVYDDKSKTLNFALAPGSSWDIDKQSLPKGPYLTDTFAVAGVYKGDNPKLYVPFELLQGYRTEQWSDYPIVCTSFEMELGQKDRLNELKVLALNMQIGPQYVLVVNDAQLVAATEPIIFFGKA